MKSPGTAVGDAARNSGDGERAGDSARARTNQINQATRRHCQSAADSGVPEVDIIDVVESDIVSADDIDSVEVVVVVENDVVAAAGIKNRGASDGERSGAAIGDRASRGKIHSARNRGSASADEINRRSE